MNEFLKKISSYNIFNYLLPGIIFVILIQNFTNYKIAQEDIIIGVFLYYFIGLIISRFGSLVIEPFLKWIKFLKFSKYKDYVVASKNDNKIEVLLEQSNMYRTFVSIFLLFFMVKMYELIGIWDKYVLLIVLLLLFLGAYKKQANYIVKRINLNKDEIREPYTEGFLNGAAGKVRAATAGRFSRGAKKTIYNAHERGALPRDVIKMPALAGGAGMIERWFLCKSCRNVYEPGELKKHKDHDIIKHPTQKPLELSRRLIKSAMPEKGGITLVPFVGTGSECVAAKELGQKYIGFEINPEYIKIAKTILNKTVRQKSQENLV